MNSQALGLCCGCLEEAQRLSSTKRAPDNSMEALEWRKPASKRFREDMECNAGVKMLSFSSPENKIGGAEVLSQDLAISITQNRSCRTSSAAGNQTPLKKQETVDCVEEPGTSSPLRTKCAFQFNYTQNNKVCGQHQESKYSCLSDSNDKEITELEKPKDATFDLPLPSIRFSERELDWAKAANRIVDKIDAEREESRVARSRRRLTLTTQLMQQIFPPLPPRSLSAEAIALHESIVYMAAMLVLTDAWSSSCFPESISSQNLRGGNMERKVCKLFENYIRRLKVLESHFLRFETSYSAADIRTECHELEKHAMIIRFTRFHECEETDGAGWLIQTANGEVFQNLFHPAGSEVLPQKLIADCAMLMKLLEGLHILSL